jgi:hypothetical protein
MYIGSPQIKCMMVWFLCASRTLTPSAATFAMMASISKLISDSVKSGSAGIGSYI